MVFYMKTYSLFAIALLACLALMQVAIADVPVPAVPTLDEAVAAAVKIARQDYAADITKAVGFAAALAVVLRYILTFLRAHAAWMGKYKYAAKWIALGGGVAVFGLTKFAAGLSWQEALIAAVGGPGAILVNELLKLRSAPTPVLAPAAEAPGPTT